MSVCWSGWHLVVLRAQLWSQDRAQHDPVSGHRVSDGQSRGQQSTSPCCNRRDGSVTECYEVINYQTLALSAVIHPSLATRVGQSWDILVLTSPRVITLWTATSVTAGHVTVTRDRPTQGSASTTRAHVATIHPLRPI